MRRWFKYRLARVEFGTVREIFARFGEHLRPHRGRFFASAAAMLGVSLVTLLQPWPIKVVFDYVLMPRDGTATGRWSDLLRQWSPEAIIAASAFSVLALAILKGVLNYTQSVQEKIVGHRLTAEIRLRLFSHVQRLPLSYHDYRETGELMTTMTGDLSLLSDLMVSTVITLASQILLIVGMLAIMFSVDWSLGVVTLAVIPLFVMAAFRFTGRIKSSARRQREAYGKIVANVQESFAGIAQVKGFAQEKAREKLIGKSAARDVKANVKTTKLTANYARTVELINALGTCAVLWIGAQRAIAGLISPGDVLVFLAYLRGMYRPLQGMARQTGRVAKATARGEKILELLDTRAEIQDAPDAVSASGIQGAIVFNDVQFSYTAAHPVLHGLSCHIPAGKTTVVLGPTGTGKSTMAKLILRLYEPTSGEILLDGRDIRDYRIRSLRKRISPLTQETFLFRTTIADNIAFSIPMASREDIERAAFEAGADGFIARLPEGYDTLVGEGGVTLSGGQRQRISIARAVLRNSPIMIFDEPATGLDVEAEDAAKEAMRRIRAGRTLLIITHRLHFVDLADHVVLIRDGRLVEEGSPEDLLARSGELARLTALDEDSAGPMMSSPL